jgi:phospholipid/cholesterol/gamma-HCH transport system ATP-binding protein
MPDREREDWDKGVREGEQRAREDGEDERGRAETRPTMPTVNEQQGGGGGQEQAQAETARSETPGSAETQRSPSPPAWNPPQGDGGGGGQEAQAETVRSESPGSGETVRSETPPAWNPQAAQQPVEMPPPDYPGQVETQIAQEREGGEGEGERSGSRVSVVDEQPPRPAPPPGADEDEYKFHTYKVYPSGRPDAVEFIDLYKGFGRAQVLRGLNLGIPEGMVSMILGPSGTGKSVCIKHMVGLLYPDEGDCLVHGQSVPNMADDELFDMRKKFGLLFQDGALFGSMNLYDNVAFPLRQHTEKGEDEIEEIVMRRLGEVGLADAKEKMPNELSGGMRKRAGFARALVLEPDIVLFDEPDSGLDPVRTALLGELILEIHRDMMETAQEKEKEHLPTFCVITHDIMSARRVADYISVLWRGRIVEAGPAEDMLNSDNPFIRQFLAGESQGPLAMD